MADPAAVPRSIAEIDWTTWSPRELATLVCVVRDGRILLIHKKRGLGEGKVNGPGGRIEPGETPEAGAIREAEEELCITPIGVSKAGEISFQFVDGYSIHVHVFRADDFVGEPTETDEAIPFWVALDAIPYDRMWADDRLWLPHLVAREPFVGRFVLDGDTMLDHAVEVADVV